MTMTVTIALGVAVTVGLTCRFYGCGWLAAMRLDAAMAVVAVGVAVVDCCCLSFLLLPVY